MKPNTDVVVVGARVAGAATALLLARRGHRVVVVDRVSPSTDTLSTHALMRTGVLQLRRWGILDAIVEAGTPAVRSINLGFGREQIGFALRDEFDVDALYAPRRPVLDMALLSAAVAAGVEFRTATTVVGVTRDDAGRVDGVRVASGGSTSTIRARFVVGADGMRSKVATAVGSPFTHFHGPMNSVIYGYFSDVPTDGYDFQFTPRAGSGLIPTNDGVVNVFVAYPRSEASQDSRDTEQVFRDALGRSRPELAERVAAGHREGRFRRSSGIPGFLRVPGGPGWVLVGDAGFTKDPLSAHGISDALRDAELAAMAVDRSIAFPDEESEALGGYQATRDRFAVPLYTETKALASHGWDEAEASRRLRVLSDITEAECRFLAGTPELAVRAA